MEIESSRTFIACARRAALVIMSGAEGVAAGPQPPTAKEQEAINTLTAGFIATLYAPTEKVTAKLDELQYDMIFLQ